MKSSVERRLFVAATNQNVGKTTCSLGFVKGFSQLGKSVGFVKPVGQHYTLADGVKVYEDSLLIQLACGLNLPLADIHPVTIDSEFVRKCIDDPGNYRALLEKVIRESFAVAAQNNELVIIEGTGHAGIGSVFGLSNARVAKILDAKAIIVTLGGIGKPIDEIALNRCLFEKEGVPVIGVIINKVVPEKLEQTRYYVSKALESTGLSVLGVIPETPRLSWPTMQQIAESIHAKVLNACEYLTNPVAEVVVGAMTPHNALTYIKDKSLLIVPGDRDDMVLAAVSLHLIKRDRQLSGIVLTGGMIPQPPTMNLVCRTDVPVLAVDELTYDTASRIGDIRVKIRITDSDKIELATSLVCNCVDLDRIWQMLA